MPNDNAREGVTRADKIKYSIQGGLSDEFVLDELEIDISDTVNNMVRMINQLSKYTHIRLETFDLDEQHTKTESKKVLRIFRDVLELGVQQKYQLSEVLRSNIEDSVLHTAISESVDGIDELASHHYVEEAETNEVEVAEIDDKKVHFVAEGFVHCELQWGSNGDQNRGNGHTMRTSFPFACFLTSSVKDPYEVETDGSQFKVDNSSWYE